MLDKFYSQNIVFCYRTKYYSITLVFMIRQARAGVAIVALASLFFVSCGTPAVRGQKTDLTDVKTEITYFDAKADMTVNNVTLDFFPENGKVLSDPKEDGNQFVRVELTFTNTGSEEFAMNYTNVTLDTSTEEDVSQTFLINDSNATDQLASKDLAPGESATGAMYFEVPGTETLSTLSVSYKGYDGESKQYKAALAK